MKTSLHCVSLCLVFEIRCNITTWMQRARIKIFFILFHSVKKIKILTWLETFNSFYKSSWWVATGNEYFFLTLKDGKMDHIKAFIQSFGFFFLKILRIGEGLLRNFRKKNTRDSFQFSHVLNWPEQVLK